jgi:hypothetical protein
VPEKQLDEMKVKQAMSALAAAQQADKEAQLLRCGPPALARGAALQAAAAQLPCRPASRAPHPSPACCLPLLRCRERQLAAVKISKEDVDLIVTEFELDAKAAERQLRECNGVLVDTLKALL